MVENTFLDLNIAVTHCNEDLNLRENACSVMSARSGGCVDGPEGIVAKTSTVPGRENSRRRIIPSP
jgi:hypothetical protein